MRDAGAAPVLMAPHRMLFPNPRSDLRVTWHETDGVLAVSLWRADACIASAQLSTSEAAELASFLVAHIGSRAASTA